jgi:hypothetical protein
MWIGRLDPEQIKTLTSASTTTPKTTSSLPLNIKIEGWNTWVSGNYLKIDETSQSILNTLLKIIQETYSLPSKGNISCDHLSLYRKRRAKVGKGFARVREALVDDDWGSVSGVSVRIKVVRSNHDDCSEILGGGT